MMIEKNDFRFYIGLGFIINSAAFCLYEVAIINESLRLCLYLIGVSLEAFGLIKYRKSTSK